MNESRFHFSNWAFLIFNLWVNSQFGTDKTLIFIAESYACPAINSHTYKHVQQAQL